MKNSYKYALIAILCVALISGFVFGVIYLKNLPGKYDNFAKCLKDKGTVFYGAFWCPHCQNQKQMFGRSAKYLPYIECSTPDKKDVTNDCKARADIIKGYPTWLFPDGTTKGGEVSMEDLAKKSGCELPTLEKK